MSQETDMLYTHCQHDSGFLKYVIEDYIRLRALEAEEWGRAGESRQRFNELISVMLKREMGGKD